MTRQQILDLYFMDARAKLIELAAFLDRIDRGEGEPDFRLAAFRKAVRELDREMPERARGVLLSLSDPTSEPASAAIGKGAAGAWAGRVELIPMRYIEPHGHMVSRTTDDYEAMVLAGCRAVCEPAFWAGFDRSGVQGFHDYFCQLTDYEPKRAAKWGLPHFTWLCLNPKESEDTALAAEVLAMIPQFLDRPNVLGIGEIGLNKNTRNELQILEQHIDLAARYQHMVLVHTPHLEDKLKGTRLIVGALQADGRVPAERVIIDHVEEHTIQLVLDAGFWAGITLYPESKTTPARAIDMFEVYGGQRVWLNSACDWGRSDPLAVPKTAVEMRKRGHAEETIDALIYGNPLRFLAQNPRFTAR